MLEANPGFDVYANLVDRPRRSPEEGWIGKQVMIGDKYRERGREEGFYGNQMSTTREGGREGGREKGREGERRESPQNTVPKVDERFSMYLIHVVR